MSKNYKGLSEEEYISRVLFRIKAKTVYDGDC